MFGLTLFRPQPRGWPNLPALSLFALWLTSVLAAVSIHVLWRDEVRALSIALQGKDLGEMLVGLKGEGHPALWYLLLRAGHAVLGKGVLPVMGVTIGAAAILLLIWCSPFGWLMLTMILCSRFSIFEYSVMARNYGISMLLMFVLAAVWSKWRDRDITTGLLLLLLANTNVPSVLLVLAFLGYELLRLTFAKTPFPSSSWRLFFVNAAIAAFGIVLCILTVLPTYNDSAVASHDNSLAWLIARAILLPSKALAELFAAPLSDLLQLLGIARINGLVQQLFASLVLYGSTFVLIRRPAALIAAIAALVAFSLLFTIVTSGDYRHYALWLVFLLTLVWASREDEKAAEQTPSVVRFYMPAVEAIGWVALGLLLAVQAADGMLMVERAFAGPPASRSRELGMLLETTPGLQDATVIAEPDFLIEPLPYYADNPTYLVREGRPGPIVHFTKQAKLDLTLDELLETAKRIQATTRHPVLILLQASLDPAQPQTSRSGYNWTFTSTPSTVARFLRSTVLVRQFGPAAGIGETFTAYRLRLSELATGKAHTD